MSSAPTSFDDWQSYPNTLDPRPHSCCMAKVLVVEESPTLGSGKTGFGATMKIALINDQK